MRRLIVSLGLLSTSAAAQTAAGPPAPLPLAADTAAVPAWTWTRAGGPDGPAFERLPLRSARAVAALAPGVRRDLATGALTVRASGREPVLVVDGVRRLGGPTGQGTLGLLGRDGAPFAAVQRVGVWTGFAPASVGEAAGGVVVVETEAGAETFGGRLEELTSEATDAFGQSVASATVRGPLGRLGGLSLTGEVRRLADALPSAGGSVRISDERYAEIQARPQAVAVRDASGAVRYVPFPTEAFESAQAAGRRFDVDNLRAALALPAGSEIVSTELVSAGETITGADVERVRAQDNGVRDLSLAGQIVLAPTPALRLRVGGGAERATADATAPTVQEAYGRRLLNRDGLSTQTRTGAHGFGVLDGQISPAVSVRLHASAEQTGATLRPSAFSDAVEDALLYGDVDADASAVARRYAFYDGEEFRPRYGVDGGIRPSTRVGGAGFGLPGAVASVYQTERATSGQAGARLTARLGRHTVELGGEAERQTFRRFALDGFSLAQYVNDEDGGQGVSVALPDGVTRYDQLPFETVRGLTSRYGYDALGLSVTDSEDVDAYFTDGQTGTRANTDVAPFRPLTAAGYLRDRVALGPVQIDAGLRVDLYDARATTLVDPYATVPILRAGDLASVPAGIGSDFAVYEGFSGGGQPVTVGFRDLDGQFYDAAGQPTDADEILSTQQGQAVQVEGSASDVFTRTEAVVTVQPRLGARVQLSPGIAATLHAARLSRRPDPALYVPFAAYEDVTGASFVPGNAALRPETVDAAGLGVEVVAAPRLTLAAGAFARRHRRVPVVRQLVGGLPSYTTVVDAGARDEVGVDLRADLARTRGLALSAGYTVTRVQEGDMPAGGFSDALVSPTDTRHEIDLVADWLVPVGAGPRIAGIAPFGGLGVGLVVAAQSGLPYTALQPNDRFSVADAFTPDIAGEVNGARLPWTSQVDLRVERRIALGPAGLTAFVWVDNLLGTRNVLAVYRATGRPDDDGFAETTSGQSVLDTEAAQFGYTSFIGGPVNVGGRQSTGAPFFYGRPRQVRLGVVLGL